ncbi:hypothetical protein CYG68_17350 [Morganella morganii]|uniref:Filamentous hemagglutinin n=1 Tax=Morganella morganii TaxID=582 RepID=A0A8I0Q3A6_MORMO|nr:hypothetical protein [Morganella morganii]MBE8614144.1 hypothetical protein [Morganella morganii]
MSEAEASQVIDSILKHDSIGPVLTKEYNEAYRYLNSAGVHLSQAVIGTDALLAGLGRISQLMRLSLAAGGSYQTGKGIAQVSDGKFAEGGTNIALGSAAIFGGYAGNKVVGKPSGGIISPENNVWQTGTIGNAITKSEGTLTGAVTKVTPQMTKENIRSLNRENESAKILSESGFNVEQNPTVVGDKKPDYRINGGIFDNYAPK